jgi:hypothetical protein
MERFHYPASNDDFDDACDLDALLHPSQAYPRLALLRRERVRKKKEDARHNQKRKPPHGLSSRLLQPASNGRPRLQILFTG